MKIPDYVKAIFNNSTHVEMHLMKGDDGLWFVDVQGLVAAEGEDPAKLLRTVARMLEPRVRLEPVPDAGGGS